MQLSIVIPTLNEEKFLPRLLDSIRRQNFKDYEIIVSDANSSDQTKKIALEYGCRFVTDKEHHHPAWQRNNGASIACGEVLLFLDADCVLQDDFFSKILKEFKSRKLYGAGFYFNFNPNKIKYYIFSFIYNSFSFVRQFFSPVSVGAAILARKDIHDMVGGFNTDILLAEDYNYCQKISNKGRFRMINSCRLLYSSRRIQKDGYWVVIWAWTKIAFYTVFNREIKKTNIKYDFGKY